MPRKRSRAPAVRFWNGCVLTSGPPGCHARSRRRSGARRRAGCRFSRDQRFSSCERAVADAAGRDVDDAHQGDGVERVLDQAQVGEQVLHLAALVEAGAADEPVRDVAADERLFDRPGLRVRPVHDGDVLVARAPRPCGRRMISSATNAGLVLFVVGLVDDDRARRSRSRSRGSSPCAAC